MTVTDHLLENSMRYEEPSWGWAASSRAGAVSAVRHHTSEVVRPRLFCVSSETQDLWSAPPPPPRDDD